MGAEQVETPEGARAFGGSPRQGPVGTREDLVRRQKISMVLEVEGE